MHLYFMSISLNVTDCFRNDFIPNDLVALIHLSNNVNKTATSEINNIKEKVVHIFSIFKLLI